MSSLARFRLGRPGKRGPRPQTSPRQPRLGTCVGELRSLLDQEREPPILVEVHDLEGDNARGVAWPSARGLHGTLVRRRHAEEDLGGRGSAQRPVRPAVRIVEQRQVDPSLAVGQGEGCLGHGNGCAALGACGSTGRKYLETRNAARSFWLELGDREKQAGDEGCAARSSGPSAPPDRWVRGPSGVGIVSDRWGDARTVTVCGPRVKVASMEGSSHCRPPRPSHSPGALGLSTVGSPGTRVARPGGSPQPDSARDDLAAGASRGARGAAGPLAGASLGRIVGQPYGTTVFQHVGMAVPFYSGAVLMALAFVVSLVTLHPPAPE